MCRRDTCVSIPVSPWSGCSWPDSPVSRESDCVTNRNHVSSFRMQSKKEEEAEQEESGLDDVPVGVQVSLPSATNPAALCWPPGWGPPPRRPAPPPRLQLPPLLLSKREQSGLSIKIFSKILFLQNTQDGLTGRGELIDTTNNNNNNKSNRNNESMLPLFFFFSSSKYETH